MTIHQIFRYKMRCRPYPLTWKGFGPRFQTQKGTKKLDQGNDALAQSLVCITPADQLLAASARALALIFWIKSSISLPGLNVTTFFAGT